MTTLQNTVNHNLKLPLGQIIDEVQKFYYLIVIWYVFSCSSINSSISQLIVQNTVTIGIKEVSSASTAKQVNPCHQFIFGIFSALQRYKGISTINLYLQSKTRKNGLVKKLYNLGVSILYSRVLELSTNIGSNNLLQNDEHDSVACSLSLTTYSRQKFSGLS